MVSESGDGRLGAMGALAPYWRLERVQQKIFVRYYGVRAGEGCCGRSRGIVDTRGIDQ
jgi:hypothetical protein